MARAIRNAIRANRFARIILESPQMWVWPQLMFGGSPPSPIVIGGPFPQAKSLPSPPFLQGSGRGRPKLVERRGPSAQGGGGGGPPSGTWGQTHIWGHSTFAMKTPISIARQADSHESLEFPIRTNHPIRANRANRFGRESRESIRIVLTVRDPISGQDRVCKSQKWRATPRRFF